jgi:lipopolysaccharide export LptBFGC system permease protein LptF
MSRGAVIEPGRFQRFGKRTILAQERLGGNHFEGIMISDYTAVEKPLLIFAESAEYSFDPETGTLHLRLENGDIRRDPYPNDEFDEHRISFAELDYSFLAPRLAGEFWRLRPNQLSFGQLRAVAAGEHRGGSPIHLRYRNPRHYESHMHRLLAIPATPLLFSLIGIPVAILGFVRSRPRGTLLALLLLGAYYALFIFVYDAARNGLFPPLPAVWAPNILVFAIAAILLIFTARSRQ